MTIFFLEKKNFSQGLSINERGEFTALYGDKSFGIPSPLAQNDKHIAVLQDAIKLIALPTRLGIKLSPTFDSAVLVSAKARLTRPAQPANVMKADNFRAYYHKLIDETSKFTLWKYFAKSVPLGIVENLGRELVALHRPSKLNYRAKFALDSGEGEGPNMKVSLPNMTGSKYYCAQCRASIPPAVASFCWNNKPRFHGKAYCRECQKAM
jgi:hypothetical protein